MSLPHVVMSEHSTAKLYYLDEKPDSYSFLSRPSEVAHTYKKPDDRGHLSTYVLGATVTVFSAVALTAACVTTFPLAGPISLFALGVLTATSYGIINDFFACRQCIQYFTVGHTTMHKRQLKTENPNANALTWGISATWVLGALAGILFAVSASATGLAVAPVLPYLAAAKFAGSLIAVTYSHFKAKKVEQEFSKPENKRQLDQIFMGADSEGTLQKGRFIKPRSKHFDIVNLSLIPEDKRAAYMGVGARNSAGYTIMPALGLVMLVAITTLGIVC